MENVENVLRTVLSCINLRMDDLCKNHQVLSSELRSRSRSRSRKESEVFGWIRSRIPKTVGAGVVFIRPTPTPDVKIDHLLHRTPKLGIPVEMV